MAAISMVLGDLSESLKHAERANELSHQSGHFRTRVAAVINIAQILTWKGDLHTARRYVAEALEIAQGNKHLMRSALDSLANLLITAGQYQESQEVFQRLAMGQDELDERRPHWDEASEVYSQARLAQAQGDLQGATELLNHALGVAQSCGDQIWSRRIRASRAQCLGLLGRQRDAIEDLEELQRTEIRNPEFMSRYYGALAGYCFGGGKTMEATGHLRRALRIATEVGNIALCKDLTVGLPPVDARHESRPHDSWTTHHHLDSAVALLELSGHPHILGREAFAVLQDTGCAEALALGGRSARGVRVIAADGWTDADALAALRAAGPDDLMPLGQHRDETWEILARPRPELDHRCTLSAIRKLIASACALDQYRRDEKQRAALWPAEALEGDAESLWVSEQSTELLHLARRIASSPMPVLLTGETGTGKEMLARVIHRASNRADRPLVPFNCTAVPHDMLESQLFGYRKGAFTSAEAAFPGVIRSASGGTLFLDEIGDVSLDLQPKLLRFIEQQEVHPLGEAHAVKVDVRIIAATNANLDELVAQGRFREDLLYRLKILPLHLPPLRERREEIPALLQHYLQKFGDEQRKGRVTLSDETLEYLLLYSWPGNIRQLANEVRRIIALVEPDATVTPSLLSQEIQASRRTLPAAGAPAEPEIRLRLDQPLPIAVDTLEQTLVRHALERSHGRVEEAARILGISRKGLFLKRRRWGLQQAS